MLEIIQWSHERSRGTYGAPRVHADLTMERGVSCGRKRVARLMRHAGIRGVCHQRKRRGWKPLPAPHDDLVKRQFTASEPDRVWFCDITQHRARDGWVYCAAVIDAYSRMVVGWSIGDHLRSELVVDALEMARWQRKPAPGTIVHSDRGAQYTSWIFGHRLRQA
jgi:putative transposase